MLAHSVFVFPWDAPVILDTSIYYENNHRCHDPNNYGQEH